jgi:hypothetical protein
MADYPKLTRIKKLLNCRIGAARLVIHWRHFVGYGIKFSKIK